MQEPVIKEEKKIQREIWSIIDENRVLSFSDAVFAFAATLLVLKIDLPNLDGVQVATQFTSMFTSLWPQYLANLISFFVIGYYWLNHHAIFGLVKRFNGTIVWLNLLFLVFLSFLPFPVDMYGDYSRVPAVVAIYSASLAVVGYLLGVLWLYASSRHRLVSAELSNRQINYYTWRIFLAPIVFTVAIPLVYIHPVLAQASWLAVIVGTVVVNKLFQVRKLSKIEIGTL